MLKSVVIEAMYRLRCWKVTERFNSPYCTRGEIGGMRRGLCPAIGPAVVLNGVSGTSVVFGRSYSRQTCAPWPLFDEGVSRSGMCADLSAQTGQMCWSKSATGNCDVEPDCRLRA